MKIKLLIIIIPILFVFFTVGWYGIEVKGTATVAEYSVDYIYYLVEPVFFTMWECQSPFADMEPCGAAPNSAHHYNGQVELLFTLCDDIPKNDSIIIDYYNTKVDKTYVPPEIISSSNSTLICEKIYSFARY